MRLLLALLIAAGSLLCGPPLRAQTITERSVAAHEAFLASDALQGRGSATRDEQIAAAYVASEFQSYGLTPAPGMSSYLQAAPIVRTRLTGSAGLSVSGGPEIRATVLIGSGAAISGDLAATRSADPGSLPGGDVVLVDADTTDPLALYAAAEAKHVKLLICVGGETADTLVTQFGGRPRLPIHLQDHAPAADATTLVFIPRDRADALVRSAGQSVTLKVPTTTEQTVTTNAIGYLAGQDPSAGALLLTAHLDHLGLRPDGVVMHGPTMMRPASQRSWSWRRRWPPASARNAASSSSATAPRRSAGSARATSARTRPSRSRRSPRT